MTTWILIEGSVTPDGEKLAVSGLKISTAIMIQVQGGKEQGCLPDLPTLLWPLRQNIFRF